MADKAHRLTDEKLEEMEKRLTDTKKQEAELEELRNQKNNEPVEVTEE